jgi:hypothetical protein
VFTPIQLIREIVIFNIHIYHGSRLAVYKDDFPGLLASTQIHRSGYLPEHRSGLPSEHTLEMKDQGDIKHESEDEMKDFGDIKASQVKASPSISM